MRRRRNDGGALESVFCLRNYRGRRLQMKIKIVVHEAEEGGYWAEVPAIPGCATQGDSMEELMANLREAIEGCLSIEVAPPEPGGIERMLELLA
jgi:predicted RNase H-like HicB family nuclease